MLNCSRPELPALLEALGPVFDLNSIRPVVHMSTPTNVSIGFTLYGILGVDEKAQVLTTYIWQEEMWKNEFVSWDADACGSEAITLPRSKLWMPDVVINEFMEENSAPYVPYVYMFHDGTVHDAQPFKVVSSCNLNVYTFPFDVQNCTFTYNSYIHRISAIQLKLAWTIEEIQQYSLSVLTTMGEWQLEDITVEKPLIRGTDDRDPYDVLYFYIRVRRRATLYVVNLIIPSCFLITVDLFSFLLPPQSVDRSTFKMTLILGYTVFLLMMNELLPTTGNGIPLISVTAGKAMESCKTTPTWVNTDVFFCLCLALMVASLLETILITKLLYSGGKLSPVPRWVQVFVLHILGYLVGLPPKPRGQGGTVIPNPAAQDANACPLVAVEGKADEQAPEVEDVALEQLRSLGKDLQAIRLQVEQQLTGNQSSEEWLQVGFIIDRLLFIFYIVFISVSFITIIGVWVMSYKKF